MRIRPSLWKEQCHLVATKARSLKGYLVGIYITLCTYQPFHKNKPTVKISEALA